jgi:LuxR family maltose regulon positive regulatory protein
MTLQQARPLVPRRARCAAVVRALEGCDLTLLVTPAGYGKTSLLGLALAAHGKPSARYTAELWQSDDFVGPLVEEVRSIRPDFGRLTLALARRPARAEASELERWAQHIGGTFARELDHVREPLVVAIEDVHVLADDPAFAGFIVGTMRALPGHVGLVLAGRTLPTLPLAEWIASGRAQLFGVEHLRFDDSEVAELASLLGSDLTAAGAAQLRETYEGWAAGLALAFTIGDRSLPSAEGSLPARSAYLLEANIATLEPAIVAFLEATCVLQTLDATVLEREPDFGDVYRCLRALERHGVMLEIVRPGEAYRLHPLLREALVARVRQRSGASGLRRANARAAAALARAGRILEALFHYEAAEDDARLANFLREHAYELFVAGQGERVGRIARRLERIGAAPVMTAIVEGMLLRQRGESGADQAFARGIDEARRTGDASAELTLRLLDTEDKLARHERIDANVLAELAILGRSGSELAEANAHVFTGWSHAIEGEFAEAQQNCRAALAIVGDDLIGVTRIASLDAYVATCLGDFESADRRMAATLRALEPSDHIVLLANTLVWFARLSLLWGDTNGARDYAERGSALARDLDLSAEIAGAHIALAHVYAEKGERERCLITCAAARRSADSAWYSIDRDRTRGMTSAFEARAAFNEGDLAGAIAVASEAFSTEMPDVQRAALASDAFAYLRLARKSDARFGAAAVTQLIASAGATDALDAAALADAAAIASAADATHASTHEALGTSVATTYAAFLVSRRERFERDPAARDSILRALQPLPPSAQSLKRRGDASELTRREAEVLELLAQGLSNREIAQRCTVSPRTVDTHVERVLSKLDATSRTRAVATALRLGLVNPA